MKNPDTLYDDVYKEMKVFMDMITWSDALGIAQLTWTIDIEDQEQKQPGIFRLFSIELYLAAAGVPSKSSKCKIGSKLPTHQAFRLNPKRVTLFEETVEKIAKIRISQGNSPEEVNAAASAMIERIRKALVVSANFPYFPVGLHPTKKITTMMDCGYPGPVDLLNDRVPPWWNELLMRCRDICEEYEYHLEWKSKLNGRISNRHLRQMVDYRTYIENPEFFPLFEPEIVDWLQYEIEKTDSSFPDLLYCVIETNIFNGQLLPEQSRPRIYPSHYFRLARRVMLETAVRKSPLGLRAYLPSEDKSGVGLFKSPMGGSYQTSDDEKHRNLLLMGWSGIFSPNRYDGAWDVPTYPEILWHEISGLSLLKDILQSFIKSNDHDQRLHVIHAWCAWCAGDWNQDTIDALFPGHVIRWYSENPPKAYSYDYRDPRFPQFCEDLNRLVAHAICQDIASNGLKSVPDKYRIHRGEVCFETLLHIAENLRPEESLRGYTNHLCVTILPEGAALKPCIKRLQSLPQKTIRRFAICSGLAYPFFLDAIDDPQFRHLTKLLIDTFSDSLVVDPENDASTERKPTPDYPGRTPSGVTNLNPLYTAIASSSPELWDDVIEEADSSNMISVSKQFLQSMVNHSEGTDSELDDSDEPEFVLHCLDFAAISRFTQRVPPAAIDWQNERQSRLDGLAKLQDAEDSYLPNAIVEWYIKNARIACRLYAESRGMASWQEAALEMADCLLLPQPVACGTYRIQQDVSQFRGAIVFKGKAKEPLKSIPPALKKEKTSALILHRCRLFHLLYRVLRKDFVDAWIETGERPGKECSAAFERIFQKSVLPVLDTESVPIGSANTIELLRQKLVPVVRAYQNDESEDVDRDPHKERIIIVRIQHFDWTFDFLHRTGNHYLRRNFLNQQLSFCFMPVTKDDIEPKIDKKKPLDMELKFIEFERNCSLCAEDPRLDRIVQCLACEIGVSRELVAP